MLPPRPRARRSCARGLAPAPRSSCGALLGLALVLARQCSLAALEDLVAPGVVESLGDVVLPADIPHRSVSSHPGEGDLQLLLGAALLPLLCQLDLLGGRAAILGAVPDASSGLRPPSASGPIQPRWVSTWGRGPGHDRPLADRRLSSRRPPLRQRRIPIERLQLQRRPCRLSICAARNPPGQSRLRVGRLNRGACGGSPHLRCRRSAGVRERQRGNGQGARRGPRTRRACGESLEPAITTRRIRLRESGGHHFVEVTVAVRPPRPLPKDTRTLTVSRRRFGGSSRRRCGRACGATRRPRAVDVAPSGPEMYDSIRARNST